jgi:hypothetical protein
MREVHAIGSVLDVVFLRHDRNFELCISAPQPMRHRSQDSETFPTCQRILWVWRGRPSGGGLITSTAVDTALAPNRFKDFWRRAGPEVGSTYA